MRGANWCVPVAYQVELLSRDALWPHRRSGPADQGGDLVDLAMGHLNVVWQGIETIEFSVLSCAPGNPPFVLNVTGPELVSVRKTAEHIAALMGKEPVFRGAEGADRASIRRKPLPRHVRSADHPARRTCVAYGALGRQWPAAVQQGDGVPKSQGHLLTQALVQRSDKLACLKRAYPSTA